MKKVIFITAPKLFRDEEYYEPKKILETKQIKVITSSLKIGELLGKFGFKTKSTILIKNIIPSNFDAIAYIGGTGASVFFNDFYALKLAKIFAKQGKPTGAICIAPVILANAGVLKNKKSTAFAEVKNIIIKKGAIYTGNALEIDNNIITANGPKSSKIFGVSFLNKLL
ncbi:MAG: DJ-1/PfpI family protein [Endomicrobium sp.]|jgi:protease I|nr:DJ-1/PfpI family protein [Endomicrobium sp.]